MGKAEKKHAKGRESLISRRLRLPAPPKQPKLKDLSSKSIRQNAYRLRLNRIRDLMLGRKRSFAGEIRTDRDEAWADDACRLHDILEVLHADRAVAYWVDGSLGGKHDKQGVVGAGVVWQTGQHEYTCTYKLGRWTGDSGDAEVFGIAAALGRAKKSIEKGKKYELVRVYSDAKALLEQLRKGSLCTLGPLLVKKTALQALFERAEWLQEKGVKVELIWVKGHKNSVRNNLADATASKAVQEGAVDSYGSAMSRRWMSRADVPTWCTEMGPDWADEWLSRANRYMECPPGFLNAHMHPGAGALDNVCDEVEAMSIDQDSSERMNEVVGVKSPPTFIMKWMKPEDSIHKHTFRDLSGTNSEEVGEDMELRDKTTGPIGAQHHEPHDPISYHAGVMRMDAAVEELDVQSESLDGEGMITSQGKPFQDNDRRVPTDHLTYNPGVGNNTLDEAHYKRRKKIAEAESLRRIEIRRIRRERDARKYALAHPISNPDDFDRKEARVGERDVSLEGISLKNPNIDPDIMMPSTESRYSPRSNIAHPDSSTVQQPLLQIPANNQPVDRSVADLRLGIKKCVSEIGNIREGLNTGNRKTRMYKYGVLQDLYKKLNNLRDELGTKTKEQSAVTDAFEDESSVAQGSRNNPYTVESSPEPEAKKTGTRDDSFVIESSPEPEPRNGSEVRWVSDDLTDVLELESQLLRE
jgi:ribonuclease HI